VVLRALSRWSGEAIRRVAVVVGVTLVVASLPVVAGHLPHANASSDGLRQFRPPGYKPTLDIWQANFEQRFTPSGAWQSNGHLDIWDLP
jgi:hypothetical protein